MKRRFFTTLVLLGVLLVAVFGATGTYGATTEDYVRIDGIDVSDFNETVDWQKVKNEGYEFTFIRIGGRYFSVNADIDDTYADSNVKTYFEGATSNNLMVGGYFFSQAITVEEAEYEATFIHEYLTECGITPSQFDLPIFMDREYISGSSGAGRLMAANLTIEQELEIELAFCNKLRELGYESGLYSYLSFLNDNTDSNVISAQGYPIWVAQYNSICQYEKQFELLQYTEDGNVDGINKETDLDYWYLNNSLHANPNSYFTLDHCSIEITSLTKYSGNSIIPTFVVKDGAKALTEGIDYEVIKYLYKTDKGTNYVLIRGLGSYTGYRAVPFGAVTKLDTPQNIKVTTVASSGKPKITWDKVDGANKYEVWRKVGSNGTYKKHYITAGTSFTNNSTTAGTTYYYKVKAICDSDSNGNSAFSYAYGVTCDLAAPANVKVTTVASSGKPKVTWDAVDSATKYEVWRKVGSNGTYKKHYITTGTSFTNNSTTAGTTYYYKVKAICSSNSNGNSAFSAAYGITCDLAAPNNVKVTTVASSGKPKVTWDAVDGATKYEVWRKTGSNGTYVKHYITTGTSFTNNSTTPGTTYYYKVKTICGANSNGNSAYSAAYGVTCDLAAPTNVKVALTSTGKPKVTWDAVDGATKYEVWRKTGSNGEYKRYYITTGTTLNNTSAVKGTQYYYKVKAICGSNANANSVFSIIVVKTSK
ncbi:MAG: hypothetical protein IKU53_00305 [Firmicutes bacterium]|nr:hypothetical protein [Bacillota bacterium]